MSDTTTPTKCHLCGDDRYVCAVCERPLHWADPDTPKCSSIHCDGAAKPCPACSPVPASEPPSAVPARCPKCENVVIDMRDYERTGAERIICAHCKAELHPDGAGSVDTPALTIEQAARALHYAVERDLRSGHFEAIDNAQARLGAVLHGEYVKGYPPAGDDVLSIKWFKTKVQFLKGRNGVNRRDEAEKDYDDIIAHDKRQRATIDRLSTSLSQSREGFQAAVERAIAAEARLASTEGALDAHARRLAEFEALPEVTDALVNTLTAAAEAWLCHYREMGAEHGDEVPIGEDCERVASILRALHDLQRGSE